MQAPALLTHVPGCPFTFLVAKCTLAVPRRVCCMDTNWHKADSADHRLLPCPHQAIHMLTSLRQECSPLPGNTSKGFAVSSPLVCLPGKSIKVYHNGLVPDLLQKNNASKRHHATLKPMGPTRTRFLQNGRAHQMSAASMSSPKA